MIIPFIVKTLRVERGDVVLFETDAPLSRNQFEHLRQEFQHAKAAGLLPDGVHYMVIDKPLDVRLMSERERRFLLDELCTTLGVRVVPL